MTNITKSRRAPSVLRVVLAAALAVGAAQLYQHELAGAEEEANDSFFTACQGTGGVRGRSGDLIPIPELSSEVWWHVVATPDGKTAVCVELLGVNIQCVPMVGCCPFGCTTQVVTTVLLDLHDTDPNRTGFYLTPVACLHTSGFGSICQSGMLNGVEISTSVTGSTVCITSVCRTI